MRVQIKLFAAARQAAGQDTVEVELSAGATVKDLRAEMLRILPDLQPLAEHLRFAVNTDYAADSTPIKETDELACIPPVSGG